MDTFTKRILVLSLIIVALAFLATIFDKDSNKTGRSQLSRRSERSPIDPNFIKPYTEPELRRKVGDTSTDESVVYSARRSVNLSPTSRAANNIWAYVRHTGRPRLGQQRFRACMHLADHDWGE